MLPRRIIQRRNPRPRRGIGSPLAVVLAGSLIAVACGDSSSRSPPEPQIQLTFVIQPSDTSAFALMSPVAVAVTDDTGATKDGSVSIAIDPNTCGATLSGTLNVATQNGVATFTDLGINLPTDGYVLKATFESATATSVAFNVATTAVGGTLTEQAAICITPRVQQDAASLAYVPQDDAFWTTDDNLPGVHVFARTTGAFLDTIRADEFLSIFPGGADPCDDGDSNPATSCSYINEFEVVTADPATGNIYVINTVNDPNLMPPVDRPAIFRLIRQNCASCFFLDEWRPLPGGFAYDGAIVINGELWIADGPNLYAYDFASNTVDILTEKVLPRNVRDLAFDGSSLWAQHKDDLREYEWPSGNQLAVHDLNVFSVDDPSGLEVVDNTLYVIEGHTGNPVRRFTETPPP